VARAARQKRQHFSASGFIGGSSTNGLPGSGNAWNFPLHVNVAPDGNDFYVLHHHGLLDDHLRLKQASAPRIKETIGRIDAAIKVLRRKHFPV
jgi:hypothetical protein